MVSKEPRSLPPPSAVVDREALQRALANAAQAHEGYALFSLVYDTAGTWERVAIIESDLPETEQQRLAEALRSNLVTPPSARALRLRVELRNGVRLAVGRRQVCLPELSNRAEIRRMVASVAVRYGGRASVVLRIRVLEDGTPGEVVIDRSSGDPRLDAEIVHVAQHMRFHPALDDRVPVAVWSAIPVAVSVAR